MTGACLCDGEGKLARMAKDDPGEESPIGRPVGATHSLEPERTPDDRKIREPRRLEPCLLARLPVLEMFAAAREVDRWIVESLDDPEVAP